VIYQKFNSVEGRFDGRFVGRLNTPSGSVFRSAESERISTSLIAFAQREGVTHVIFGQTTRSRWELLWRGSTLDRFLAAVPDAAEQVVPLTDAAANEASRQRAQ
jgi:two-component system sensor histidine kinase KdpD